MVWQIPKKLEEDGARPTMSWHVDHFAHYPHVKGLVHQETWLDK